MITLRFGLLSENFLFSSELLFRILLANFSLISVNNGEKSGDQVLYI